ncbi:Glycosyltransferase involved in cell wall bisynthesis [Microbacterium sp. ru370.1]|uniref:glycosyltransferase n=1 Tax=unclassified Microbacterium TaxID=2609290 RepID=UPI00088C6CF3|nr:MULTISPECIES: glycosyltransferase [unclassified Microbacterium]SDO30874.1 Glycosyltransferase involved in cell wall bisynthesis [Microbacterium sp. ru370.1]SIT76186.1 Glycosyltransferase involved in cell wall bisynthesis [Microbacterium sp. RU1D]
MHVVMFADQHLESLGGAQVSMRLQKRFLERAGHVVTVVAPRLHRPASDDPAYLDLPSIAITPDREYALTWPGSRTDRFLDAEMGARLPVDVVHVQADFWGAFIGHRFAARHGLPVVHTMHNRVDVGIEATAPFPGLVLRALNAWARRALPAVRQGGGSSHGVGADPRGSTDPGGSSPNVPASRVDGWAFLHRLARLSRAVTAPSGHFARRLERHGVAPSVDVIWNGIDDDVLDAALAFGASTRRPGRPRFVWLGRMSPEKRLLPFLEAVVASGIDADVEIIGGGAQLKAAQRLVERRRPGARVTFAGRLPYAETLARLADADAVVQTSIGFETQGMTVFEAASLGTPAVVTDPDIAAELGGGTWTVADATVAALAETLRRAAADIAAGSPVRPESSIAERFRQSSRTAAMVAVYERAVAAGR